MDLHKRVSHWASLATIVALIVAIIALVKQFRPRFGDEIFGTTSLSQSTKLNEETSGIRSPDENPSRPEILDFETHIFGKSENWGPSIEYKVKNCSRVSIDCDGNIRSSDVSSNPYKGYVIFPYSAKRSIRIKLTAYDTTGKSDEHEVTLLAP